MGRVRVRGLGSAYHCPVSQTPPPTKAASPEEEEFLRLMAEAPEDLAKLFEITRALKKKGEKEKPRALLHRLEGALKEKNLPRARLETMLEICRAFPHRAATAGEVLAAFREAHPGHPTLESLLAFYFKPKVNLLDAAEHVKRWLPFVPGGVFYFEGHGAGRVVDVRPAIDAVRLDFEGGEKLSLPPGAASRNLIPLAPGDFRRERLEDARALGELSLADPPDALRHLIESLGRPLTAAEIKSAFTGAIPPEKWISFWNAARKHPQVVLSGAGKNAAYSWSGSAEAAHGSVRDEFDAAAPVRRLEIARQNARRTELSAFFQEGLARAAEAAVAESPGAALEIAFFLEDGRSAAQPSFSVRDLLGGEDGPAIARSIGDPSARIRAYHLLRELQEKDWLQLFTSLFAEEEDARALAFLDSALSSDAPQAREELLTRILSTPRSAPRAFLWLCERRETVPGVNERLGPPILPVLLEAVRSPEFSAHRARLKALFDRGGLALELATRVPDAEEARRLAALVERTAGLEEFRREDFKQALQRKFPELRGPRTEPLYVTAESLAEKKAELENLLKVEIPRNGKAIQEAAALGDLTENFEYQAARARQEFLSARAAQLRSDLSRARPIEPAAVLTTEVRVGARVRLVSPEGTRLVTILGPWDSRPEEQIYSYQSEIAHGLLGKKTSEKVKFDGRDWEIAEIEPWRR
jgi:transcription elongation GreA/GreB family factor